MVSFYSRNIFLVIACFVVVLQLSAKEIILFDANLNHEKAVEILFHKKNTYVITEHGVYKKNKDKLVKKFTSKAIINVGAFDNDTLLLGTKSGLFKLSINTYKEVNVPLPVTYPESSVKTIVIDKQNQIWVGVEAYGLYLLKGNSLSRMLGVFPINTSVVTKDSSMWVGTDAGLHRYHDSLWIRYNEEGVANFEIPDNGVNRLIIDNVSNLWVIMSQGISIFSFDKDAHGHSDGHLPTVKYIGTEENEILGITYIKGEGYLFTTKMGLLFLPTENATHIEEFEHGESDKVENKSSLYKCSLATLAITNYNLSNVSNVKTDSKNNLWLLNDTGILILSDKEQSKLAKKKI